MSSCVGALWLAILVGLALGGSAFVSSTVWTLTTLDTELFRELTLDELELEDDDELDAVLGRLSGSSLIDGASLWDEIDFTSSWGA